ncbi:hypothetical protein [Bradyrhizobium sp. BR 10289]|uniref:hypothetical protein n=1 Tax=Bradyrhizobium sp. BR 10289 TaxID=2749993 RepID=UPI001C6489FE|nr:hypothetical protein [Bradyrhizobium sp. BR 10289]MBW7973498.1 hypothetical protein [Bradyrhizobium sp. BR 10289]
MRRIYFALVCVLTLLTANHANAQATRTWVSGVGDDVNPCSRTAPCKTFAGAISKTAAGGEINCLDPGAYGSVTITKSMSIYCDIGTAGVLHSATNGIVINASATDSVYLEGLDINGAPPTAPGLIGISFLQGASLHVKNTRIHDQTGSPSGHGIAFTPTNSAKLIVENVTITNTGAGAGGAAILVNPGAGASAFALISKSHLHRGNFGVVGDSSGGATGINIVVRDTVANGFANTAFLTTGSNIGMLVKESAATASGTGLSASPGTTIRVGASIITGNGTSVSGNVLSFGDNQINGNGVDAIPAPVPGGSH